MTEWWTYHPSDFLMFSPRIYWRLFQSVNHALWPTQLLLVGIPLSWMAARIRRRSVSAQAIGIPTLFLAGCWFLVAWLFLHQRFAPINWIADAYAAMFAVAAVGMLALAAAGKLRNEAGDARTRIATALGLWALLVHPLLAVLSGRPWQQAEVFGLAPDPTAVGTLGFLLLVRPDGLAARWLRLLICSIGVAWCLISAATLATMESMQAAVPLCAAILALIALRIKD